MNQSCRYDHTKSIFLPFSNVFLKKKKRILHLNIYLSKELTWKKIKIVAKSTIKYESKLLKRWKKIPSQLHLLLSLIQIVSLAKPLKKKKKFPITQNNSNLEKTTLAFQGFEDIDWITFPVQKKKQLEKKKAIQIKVKDFFFLFTSLQISCS